MLQNKRVTTANFHLRTPVNEPVYFCSAGFKNVAHKSSKIEKQYNRYSKTIDLLEPISKSTHNIESASQK